MKLASVLLLASVLKLCASTITYTTSASGSCNMFLACEIDLTLPQWNPGDGTLKQIMWTLTDQQHVDLGTQFVGYTYNIDLSSSDSSAPLSLSVPYDNGQFTFLTGLTDQTEHTADPLDVRGAILTQSNQLAPFLGTGTISIPVSPFLWGDYNYEEPNFAGRPYFYREFYLGNDPYTSNLTLELSYIDDPLVTPEPRYGWMAIVFLVLFWRFSGLSFAGSSRKRARK
jgi:hypothetical protein